MLSLIGKVALVTGCGSNGNGWSNGKAIATLFARQGATVFGIDRDIAAAETSKVAMEAQGLRLAIAACDVTQHDQVENAIADCIARFGRLDILINNVGQSEPGTPETMEPGVWQRQLDLNLTSAFLTTRAVLPLMEKQGSGAIVNVSSVAGLRWVGKNQVGYAAAKAGLMHFTRVTAVAYAAKGIRLNSVVPGLIFTPLVERLAERYAGGDYDGFVEKRHQQVPMGRMGDAWDVAHATLFLASDEARYVTGTEIVVDGGLTASTGTM